MAQRSLPGERMFVAVRPSLSAAEDLSAFLEPRDAHPWIDPQQWHITLAFLPGVPPHRVEELATALQQRLSRRPTMRLSLGGAGAFPNQHEARVLWMGVHGDVGLLAETARAVRNTCNHVGATPDGQAFVPHLTVSRLRRAQEQTRWVQVLQTYTGPSWTADEVHLVASSLAPAGRGRPRHETVAVARLTERKDFDGATG